MICEKKKENSLPLNTKTINDYETIRFSQKKNLLAPRTVKHSNKTDKKSFCKFVCRIKLC